MSITPILFTPLLPKRHLLGNSEPAATLKRKAPDASDGNPSNTRDGQQNGKEPDIKVEEQPSEQTISPQIKTGSNKSVQDQDNKTPETHEPSETDTATTGEGSQDDKDAESKAEEKAPPPPLKRDGDTNIKKKSSKRVRLQTNA